MEPSRWDEYAEQLRQEHVRRLVEYTAAGNQWRFLEGLRYFVLGISGTIFAALFVTYRIFLEIVVSGKGTWFEKGVILLIPWTGIIFSIIADNVEKRIELYLINAAYRAEELEEELGIGASGIFRIMQTRAMAIRLLLTPSMIRTVFWGLGVVWFALGIHSGIVTSR